MATRTNGVTAVPSLVAPPPPTLPLLPNQLASAAFPLDSLPPELISYILSFLPLEDLIRASQTCALTYEIASRSNLSGPTWAPPIAAALDSAPYPEALSRLGCYSYVPRPAFVPILVEAKPQFIGGPMTIPVGFKERDWEDVMRTRFLPSWSSEDGNWRRTGMKWKELYMRSVDSSSVTRTDGQVARVSSS
jgi:hypothetical protein